MIWKWLFTFIAWMFKSNGFIHHIKCSIGSGIRANQNNIVLHHCCWLFKLFKIKMFKPHFCHTYWLVCNSLDEWSIKQNKCQCTCFFLIYLMINIIKLCFGVIESELTQRELVTYEHWKSKWQVIKTVVKFNYAAFFVILL